MSCQPHFVRMDWTRHSVILTLLILGYMSEQDILHKASPDVVHCAVIMADDSGSMRGAENGTRIDDLRAILERITGSSINSQRNTKTYVLL